MENEQLIEQYSIKLKELSGVCSKFATSVQCKLAELENRIEKLEKDK